MIPFESMREIEANTTYVSKEKFPSPILFGGSFGSTLFLKGTGYFQREK